MLTSQNPNPNEKQAFILFRPFLAVWKWLVPPTQAHIDRQSRTARFVFLGLIVAIALALVITALLKGRDWHRAYERWLSDRDAEQAVKYENEAVEFQKANRKMESQDATANAIRSANAAWTEDSDNPNAIRALARLTTRMGKPEARFFWDKLEKTHQLTDEDFGWRIQAFGDIEIVFHVGAAMKGGNFEYQSGTIWGTRNVIDACERHHVGRLVYVSSLSVLDHAGHRPEVVVNEYAPYEPYPEQRGLYTQTKLQAERMVLDAAAAKRVYSVVLRPGQIYGPGTAKVPPSGTIGIAGRWLVVGKGAHHVPLVYVDNVVDALILAANADVASGSVFQLVDPQGITQRAYVNYASRARTGPVRAMYVPPWFLKIAGFGVELLGKMLKRSVPLTPYRVQSITPLWPCDCTAAHTILGWRPRVSIQEGMAQTFPE